MYIEEGRKVELFSGSQEEFEREKGFPVETIEYLRNKDNGKFAYFASDTHYEFMGKHLFS